MCFDASISPVIPSMATRSHHWLSEPFRPKNVASRIRTEEIYEERFGFKQILEFALDISTLSLNIEVSFLCIVLIETHASSASSDRVCLRKE